MFDILVVEDDRNLRRIICTVLTKNGYNAIEAEDGRAALDLMESKYIDLIISDIMMPNMDGYELTEALRNAAYTLPILMVSAKESFGDKKRGFAVGTDDYMVKPIDVNELLLRVSALLRRAKIANEHKLFFGKTLLDYDSFTAYYGSNTVELPQKEFLLLYKLLSYPNKIFTRQQLMDEIWGYDTSTDERTVDVHINRLRERVGMWSDFEIITVRGLGYKAVLKV
ncbi:MAG: DNA-binding response regulator [Firmicutes bacterium HGW-Firmicutes-21]|nr:MAG: DNA-binding response regulator [Firmicutes bacterium HGW-Firmicutes-21]